MRCGAAPGTLKRRQVDHWYLDVWLQRAEHGTRGIARREESRSRDRLAMPFVLGFKAAVIPMEMHRSMIGD
jgi:hypothetical protein